MCWTECLSSVSNFARELWETDGEHLKRWRTFGALKGNLVVAVATTLVVAVVVGNMTTVSVPFSLTYFVSDHHHRHCLHNYGYKIIDTLKLSNDKPDTNCQPSNKTQQTDRHSIHWMHATDRPTLLNIHQHALNARYRQACSVKYEWMHATDRPVVLNMHQRTYQCATKSNKDRPVRWFAVEKDEK